jgi:hypothetical protein
MVSSQIVFVFQVELARLRHFCRCFNNSQTEWDCQKDRLAENARIQIVCMKGARFPNKFSSADVFDAAALCKRR